MPYLGGVSSGVSSLASSGRSSALGHPDTGSGGRTPRHQQHHAAADANAAAAAAHLVAATAAAKAAAAEAVVLSDEARELLAAQASRAGDSLSITRSGPALVQSGLSPFGELLALWREPQAGAIFPASAGASSSVPPPTSSAGGAGTAESRGMDVWVGITSRGYVVVWSAGAALDPSGSAGGVAPPTSTSASSSSATPGLGALGGGPVNPSYLPSDSRLLDFEKILGENYRRLSAACFTLPKLTPPGAPPTSPAHAQTAQLASRRGTLTIFVLTEEGHGLTYSVELGVIVVDAAAAAAAAATNTTITTATGAEASTAEESNSSTSKGPSGTATPNPTGIATAVTSASSSSQSTLPPAVADPSRRIGIVAHRRLLLRKALYQRDGLPSSLAGAVAMSGLAGLVSQGAQALSGAASPPRPANLCFDPLTNWILFSVDMDLIAVSDLNLQTIWTASVGPAILGGGGGGGLADEASSAAARAAKDEKKSATMQQQQQLTKGMDAKQRRAHAITSIAFPSPATAALVCAAQRVGSSGASSASASTNLSSSQPNNQQQQSSSAPPSFVVVGTRSGFVLQVVLRRREVLGGAVFKLLPVVTVLARMQEHQVLHEDMMAMDNNGAGVAAGTATSAGTGAAATNGGSNMDASMVSAEQRDELARKKEEERRRRNAAGPTNAGSKELAAIMQAAAAARSHAAGITSSPSSSVADEALIPFDPSELPTAPLLICSPWFDPSMAALTSGQGGAPSFVSSPGGLPQGLIRASAYSTSISCLSLGWRRGEWVVAVGCLDGFVHVVSRESQGRASIAAPPPSSSSAATTASGQASAAAGNSAATTSTSGTAAAVASATSAQQHTKYTLLSDVSFTDAASSSSAAAGSKNTRSALFPISFDTSFPASLLYTLVDPPAHASSSRLASVVRLVCSPDAGVVVTIDAGGVARRWDLDARQLAGVTTTEGVVPTPSQVATAATTSSSSSLSSSVLPSLPPLGLELVYPCRGGAHELASLFGPEGAVTLAATAPLSSRTQQQGHQRLPSLSSNGLNGNGASSSGAAGHVDSFATMLSVLKEAGLMAPSHMLLLSEASFSLWRMQRPQRVHKGASVALGVPSASTMTGVAGAAADAAGGGGGRGGVVGGGGGGGGGVPSVAASLLSSAGSVLADLTDFIAAQAAEEKRAMEALGLLGMGGSGGGGSSSGFGSAHTVGEKLRRERALAESAREKLARRNSALLAASRDDPTNTAPGSGSRTPFSYYSPFSSSGGLGSPSSDGGHHSIAATPNHPNLAEAASVASTRPPSAHNSSSNAQHSLSVAPSAASTVLSTHSSANANATTSSNALAKSEISGVLPLSNSASAATADFYGFAPAPSSSPVVESISPSSAAASTTSTSASQPPLHSAGPSSIAGLIMSPSDLLPPQPPMQARDNGEDMHSPLTAMRSPSTGRSRAHSSPSSATPSRPESAASATTATTLRPPIAALSVATPPDSGNNSRSESRASPVATGGSGSSASSQQQRLGALTHLPFASAAPDSLASNASSQASGGSSSSTHSGSNASGSNDASSYGVGGSDVDTETPAHRREGSQVLPAVTIVLDPESDEEDEPEAQQHPAA
jgi:hypothetical protein